MHYQTDTYFCACVKKTDSCGRNARVREPVAAKKKEKADHEIHSDALQAG